MVKQLVARRVFMFLKRKKQEAFGKYFVSHTGACWVGKPHQGSQDQESTGRTEAINGDAQKAERDEAHEDDPS